MWASGRSGVKLVEAEIWGKVGSNRSSGGSRRLVDMLVVVVVRVAVVAMMEVWCCGLQQGNISGGRMIATAVAVAVKGMSVAAVTATYSGIGTSGPY